MLASDLRKIADKENNQSIDDQAKILADRLFITAAKYADKGSYSLSESLHSSKYPRAAYEAAIKDYLKPQGFTCYIQSRITTQYSNTDYDSEDFFIMEW